MTRTVLRAVLGALVTGAITGVTVAAPKAASPGASRVLFPAALLKASDDTGVCLLAEVGTWKGRSSVESSGLAAAREAEATALETMAASAGYRISEKGGWILVRADEWFWLPRRDCDSAVLLTVFRDGGLTTATVPAIAAMPPLQRRTLQEWLAREQPGQPVTYPELQDLEDDRAVKALELWATLTPHQLQLITSPGLDAKDLSPPQAALFSTLLWQVAGLRWSPQAAYSVRLEVGPRQTSRWSRYHPGVPEPPGRAENRGTIALTATGWAEGQGLEVPLAIADPAAMESRRRNLKGFLATDFGRIKSSWPREEHRTGLTTPFTLRCPIVKVKDLLLAITRECGVHLQADDWARDRYLVANFNDKTVDELRAALAELLKCKWRYDQEGEYWLLYQDEEARKEEARLVAEKEAEERQTVERRVAENPMSVVVKDLLKELDRETADRIQAALSVDVPLGQVPRDLWATIADRVLFHPSGDRRSHSGWDMGAEDLVDGWLEFRRALSDDILSLHGVFSFERGTRSAGDYRFSRIRTELGPVLLLAPRTPDRR